MTQTSPARTRRSGTPARFASRSSHRSSGCCRPQRSSSALEPAYDHHPAAPGGLAMPVPSGQIPPLWAWRETDWGIEGGWPSWRARVLRGCSAHNGCFIVWGPPADYDDWAQAGNPGWSHAALDPYRRRAEHALRARPSRVEDLEPLERAGLEGAAELGLPLLEDFDDPRPPRARRPSRSMPWARFAGTRCSPISTPPGKGRTSRSWPTPWWIGCTWRDRGSPG
jgi:choline dehydrogenase-like flavoprotein